jgi:hypothetical protein
MSIKKINQWPEGSGSLTNDDVFLFMDNPSGGGITKKISLSEIANVVGDAITPADIGAAALPTAGLSITKSGDWAPQSPTQFFNLVPAQAVQFGSTYTRYSGQWIASWAYTEAAWITGQTRITSLTFDNLEGVTGNYAPTSMSAITTLSLPNLSYVGGNYAPSSMSALTTLSTPNLSYVGGNFSPITITALTSLSAPNLSYVGGGFSMSSMSALTTMSTPNLSYVGGAFTFLTLNSLTTLSLTNLSYVGGAISLSSMSALTTMSLPNLSYVGGNFTPQTMAALTSLSAPNLSYVGGNFNPQTMAALTSLSLTNLSYVGGQLLLSNCGALTTISLPALNWIGNSTANSITLSTGMTSLTTLSLPALAYIYNGGVTISAPALANLTLPTNGTFKNGGFNFAITGAVLTQASVDNILQAYASLDGTNGTTAFAFSLTVTGSSAAPSNAGSTTTAGSNFVCSGSTCTVNWTAHGYTTGDVLRISGITTATAANKYAVINVVNANQFTYVLSTLQTATGAGTATVVKAAASAKKLVTRGVTLTTN